MNELSAEDKSYMAGIIDGEGHIGITEYVAKARLHGPRYKPETVGKEYASYKRMTLMVNVKMTNREIPEWFYLIFGGTFSKYESTEDNRKDLWLWQVSNTKALICLEILQPYLRIKRAHAVIAIQFQKSRVKFGTHKTRFDKEVDSILVSTMHQLNKTGKDRRQL